MKQRAREIATNLRILGNPIRKFATSKSGTHPPAILRKQQQTTRSKTPPAKTGDSWLPFEEDESKAKAQVAVRAIKPPAAREKVAKRSGPPPSSSVVVEGKSKKTTKEKKGQEADKLNVNQRVTLSREHLLEKVQLLERLFALQDKEKEIDARQQGKAKD